MEKFSKIDFKIVNGQKLKSAQSLMKRLGMILDENKIPYDKKVLTSSTWRMRINVNISSLVERCQKLKKDLQDKYGITEEIANITINNRKNDEISQTLSVTNNTKKRKAPNQPAKNYEDGTQMISENNGKNYYVKSYSDGRKRWCLVK